MSIPETMNALQAVKHGSAEESLAYNQVKTPKITRPNQLLIKVKATAINPVEAKFRAGNMVPLPLPRIMGSDYAGIVVDKGAKVTKFEIGDEVFGVSGLPIGPNGTYAEYVIATLGTGGIAKKPENMSFEEAAGVGIAFSTAYQAIEGLGNLPKEGAKKVLVIGASGGVGTYAVQYAKAIPDTTVIAICSGKNAGLVKSLGADRIVDYTSKESVDALTKDEIETYDLIVDCIGGEEYYYLLYELLKKKGTYSTIVGPIEHVGAERLGLFAGAKMVLTIIGRKLFGARYYQYVSLLPWDKIESDMLPYLADGRVKTVLRDDQIFDLKDGVLAHKIIESHRTVGKVILRV